MAPVHDVVDVRALPANQREQRGELAGLVGAAHGEAEIPAGGDETIPVYVIPAAGPWRIVLRDFFGDMANYRLGLERAR